MGFQDRGRALWENRPQLSSAPPFNNLIIVNKRVVVNTQTVHCNLAI
jgi:hypothetical protein